MRFFFFLALVATTFAGGALGQKLKAEEIVAKHIEAIGKAEARAVKNRVALGSAEFTREASTSKILGRGVLAFENGKSAFALGFDNPRYPQDKMGFDGKKVNVGFILPGERSALGRYIQSFGDPFSEGLFGGALSPNWVLLDLAARKARVDNDGSKKIDGRDTWVLSYSPKGGSDLTIKIYIDKENFRHLRTEYRKIISAQQGRTVDSSARQREARYFLTEDFSDFRDEYGAMLPHSMKLTLLTDAMSGAETNIWELKFEQFFINQDLEPATFDIR